MIRDLLQRALTVIEESDGADEHQALLVELRTAIAADLPARLVVALDTVLVALDDASSVVDKSEDEEYAYQVELESGRAVLAAWRGEDRNLSPAENYPIIGQCQRCGRDLQESDDYTSVDLVAGPFTCSACEEAQ